MAADPHRSNQPLVNGQNGEGGPSKGNSNRDTVDGEDLVQKQQYPQHNPQHQGQFFGQQPHPGQQQLPPHLNWPRQPRPPDPRGPPRPLQQQQPGLRRVSPWAVLRNKLPDQPQQLFHQQYRMQSDDMARPPLNGFTPRPIPPQMAMRPPSGQLSKPPSLEGPSPPMGPTPPRSPFLQRGDSRTGAQMFSPPMPRPPLSLSPRPSLSLNRSRDDDDGDDPMMNTPGVRPPVRFPTPQLVRTPSGGVSPVPSRPPSRATPSPTPPGAPIGPRSTPPPQSRQLSVNEPDAKSDIKSSSPSPRQLSSATSQESDDAPNPADVDKPIETARPANQEKPAEAEKPAEPSKPATPIPETPRTPAPPEDPKEQQKEVLKKSEEAPKRPNLLETSRQERTETHNGSDSKDSSSSNGSKSKEPVVNGSHETPKKLPPKATATTPKKLGPVPSGAKSPSKSLPRTPQTPDTPGTSEKKKLPMNKIQVGAAPSPNLKVVRSKIGSLENAKHKPGGGNVKIESRKLDFKTGSRIEAKNDAYAPGGGEKKIQQVKLQWNAKSKIGSLENATHKPGGGDKKIETVKLDFKDKAKPKIGSKDNIKHIPGGGNVKIEDQKLEIKAQSKIGSLDNVKHKPGGGEVKIFDDREYMKQMMGSTSDVHSASNQRRTSRSSSSSRTRLSGSKSGTRENLTDDLYSPEKPNAKPLTKPTDQNSNQLNRSQPETTAASSGPAAADGVPKPKEDFQTVIEKSQTETPEKQLTKP